jgi:hypothetical protein
LSKTIQRRSWAELDEPGKDLTLKKTEVGENENLISSIADDLRDIKKELEKMVKVHDSLCDAREYYFQAVQRVTQSLERLVQGMEIQDEEKEKRNEN